MICTFLSIIIGDRFITVALCISGVLSINRGGVIRPGGFTFQNNSISRLWHLKAYVELSAIAIAVGCHVHYLTTFGDAMGYRAVQRNRYPSIPDLTCTIYELVTMGYIVPSGWSFLTILVLVDSLTLCQPPTSSSQATLFPLPPSFIIPISS